MKERFDIAITSQGLRGSKYVFLTLDISTEEGSAEVLGLFLPVKILLHIISNTNDNRPVFFHYIESMEAEWFLSHVAPNENWICSDGKKSTRQVSHAFLRVFQQMMM